MTRMSIDAVATTYSLLDLWAALQEYTIRFHNRTIVYGLGGWRSSNSYDIPFQALHVWDCIRMQSKCFHKPHKVLPVHTVNAMPKSDGDWQFGRFDSVLVNKDPNKIWPQSGLEGMSFNLNIKSSYIFCTLRSFVSLIILLSLHKDFQDMVISSLHLLMVIQLGLRGMTRYEVNLQIFHPDVSLLYAPDPRVQPSLLCLTSIHIHVRPLHCGSCHQSLGSQCAWFENSLWYTLK